MRILHAVHDFLPRHRAGAEIYAFELAHTLAARHHVTVLCAEYDPTQPQARVRWRLLEGLPVVEIINNWDGDAFADTYRSPQLTARLDEILDAVEPDVLHLHSLLNLSFDLPALARARGIPVVATLHDYTLVCPSGGQRLHRAESHVCREIDPDRCVRCFGASPFARQWSVSGMSAAVAGSSTLQQLVGVARRWAPGLLQHAAAVVASARPLPVVRADILERLAQARRVFDLVDRFVAPSPSIAEEFCALGLPRDKVHVSDYGFRTLPSRTSAPRADRLRIGFVGTLVWHKGVHVLIDAVARLPPAAYELRLFGDVLVFPDYVAELRRRADGLPVHFMGRFESDQTADIYPQFDVLVVPSLWLENSPLVIHEAFMLGVPVIGARMGGIADLVIDGVNGRLYDAASSEALAGILRPLLTERAPLASWAAALPAVKSIDDDAAEWERLYESVVSTGPAVAGTV